MNLLRLQRRDPPARPAADEQRLRRTVEQMPTAVVMFDAADFTILFANAATSGMLATLAPALAGPGGLVGTRIGALHPDLARAAVQLSPATQFPVTGRLHFGAETVDYLLSPVVGPEPGRPEAYLLTWWVSTAQGQVAERFEGEVKSLFDRLVATTGELGSSSDEVANLVETTRQETQAASTAAEQLAAAIRDICVQLSRASQVSEKAVGEACTSDSRIGSLAQSAAAIGNIVAIINEIADRTNLLALNATIEAARGCRRQGLRGCCPRGQDAGRPDRQGDGRHLLAGRRHPGGERGSRLHHRRHRPDHRGDPRHPRHDLGRRRAAVGRHPRRERTPRAFVRPRRPLRQGREHDGRRRQPRRGCRGFPR